MHVQRLDDYQGWQVVHRGAAILIDPWLTAEPIRGAFDRDHPDGFITLDALGRGATTLFAALLCAGVSDHLRPGTLAILGDTPVHGPPAAARAARALGCPSTTAHRPGDVFEVGDPQDGALRITVTRTGWPLGRIAVGYVIEAFDDGSPGGRIWIDPHLPTVAVARGLAPIDLALLPTESVIAGILPVTAGPRRSAAAAIAAQARIVVPTATDPGRDMSPWQRRIYRVAGGTSELRALLSDTATEVVTLDAGDRLML